MKAFFRRLSAAILIITLLATSASALSVDEALGLLDETYLGNISDQARQADSLDELFSLLGDPYTGYMTAQEYQDFLYSVEGTQTLVGIGVAIELTEEGILITEVIQGNSAHIAGIAVGDVIIAIDGTSCVPANESHQALISGAEHTTVTLTLLRNGAPYTCTLLRQRVVIPNASFTVTEEKVGYIQCTSFGQDTGILIARNITQYDRQVDCWLLDLRSNVGGYSTAGVGTVGAFAGIGNHMFLRDNTEFLQYYTYHDPAATDKSVVVLVNEASASASELVAAGIKDTGSGIVVGSRTFGKGIAQILLDETTHPDLFSGDGLKVTAYRFYSYGGNTTDRIGVIPTLMVDDRYAAEVAQALCGAFREDYTTEGQMMLAISDQHFYIDMDSLTPEGASALLSALPPNAKLYLGANTYDWNPITFEDAARLLGTTYTNRWFDDVAGSPYGEEINALATYSLLLGDGTGSFLPDGQLTRAQVCAMLAQLLGLSYDGPSRFTDVPETAWYADEVNAMAELGLVEGVGNGRFQPNTVLSQQEFFTILGRMVRWLNFRADDYAYRFYDQNGYSTLPLYHELDAFASWSKEPVAVLAWSSEALGAAGSMLFDDLEDLSPTAPITREEAAASLYRMLSITGILDA